MRRAKGKRSAALRSERVERSFAHVCDSGGCDAVAARLANVTEALLNGGRGAPISAELCADCFGIGKRKLSRGLRALAALTDLLPRRSGSPLRTLRINSSPPLQRFAVPHDSAPTA